MTAPLKSLAELTRKDFPIFSKENLEAQNIIYLDYAATSQKPKSVIKSLVDYYSYSNANVHRGAHQLSAKATEAFENARKITANFIKASSAEEIVFTRNATEAINLVANSWVGEKLKKGDEILLTVMEHHSNLVPWQLAAKRKGLIIKYASITDSGELNIEDFKNKLSSKTKLVSLVHISNALGTCNPINIITELAHKYGAYVMLDACQSLPHRQIDVNSLNIDFLAGSSHKLCGPTGVGFLWAKKETLNSMPPFLGGGEMIENVYLNHDNTWADLPHKFEAGTPAIGEAIAMGEAINYLNSIGIEEIENWERSLTFYLFEKLRNIDGINILGPTPESQRNRGCLATFYVNKIHSNDISALLDSDGICIRSGHHCCQPLHRLLNISSTARASISFTTTKEEIDIFTDKLKSTINFLRINS